MDVCSGYTCDSSRWVDGSATWETVRLKNVCIVFCLPVEDTNAQEMFFLKVAQQVYGYRVRTYVDFNFETRQSSLWIFMRFLEIELKQHSK